MSAGLAVGAVLVLLAALWWLALFGERRARTDYEAQWDETSW